MVSRWSKSKSYRRRKDLQLQVDIRLFERLSHDFTLNSSDHTYYTPIDIGKSLRHPTESGQVKPYRDLHWFVSGSDACVSLGKGCAFQMEKETPVMKAQGRTLDEVAINLRDPSE